MVSKSMKRKLRAEADRRGLRSEAELVRMLLTSAMEPAPAPPVDAPRARDGYRGRTRLLVDTDTREKRVVAGPPPQPVTIPRGMVERSEPDARAIAYQAELDAVTGSPARHWTPPASSAPDTPSSPRFAGSAGVE